MTISTTLIWFLVGAAFLIAELMVPGFILIFFTAGSWITALAVWGLDVQITGQIIIFIVSSLALLLILRKYGLKTFRGQTAEDIDDNYADSKIGKAAVVTKAISPHLPGEIKVSGSFWRAVAEVEIEEGRSVLIEGHEAQDALTFKVKPV
jgi:inner membrane protein